MCSLLPGGDQDIQLRSEEPGNWIIGFVGSAGDACLGHPNDLYEGSSDSSGWGLWWRFNQNLSDMRAPPTFPTEIRIVLSSLHSLEHQDEEKEKYFAARSSSTSIVNSSWRAASNGIILRTRGLGFVWYWNYWQTWHLMTSVKLLRASVVCVAVACSLHHR